MSTSATPMTSSASVYVTSAFWERMWRTSGIQSVGLFIIAYAIYGHQPQVAASTDTLVSFYDGDRTWILIAAIFSGLAVLNLLWFAAALRNTLADAGQDGWGAAATAASANARSTVAAPGNGGCITRLLDRRFARSSTRIRTERILLGSRRADFIPTRDVDHVWCVRPLAGQADFQCALCNRCSSCRARVTGRHHLVERRNLGSRRRIFAVRFSHPPFRMGSCREPGSLEPSTRDACRVVIRIQPHSGISQLGAVGSGATIPNIFFAPYYLDDRKRRISIARVDDRLHVRRPLHMRPRMHARSRVGHLAGAGDHVPVPRVPV